MINNWKIPEAILKKADITKIEGINLEITKEKVSDNLKFANLIIAEKNPFGIKKLKIPVNEKLLNKKEPNSIENHNAIIKDLIKENYYTKKRPLFTKLPFDYTKIPVNLRLLLNRLLLKQKKDPGFPEWSIERSVELIRYFFIKTIKNKIGNVPYISFWPKGEFAFSVSHDCDSASSFDKIEDFRSIENKYDIKSSWNIVPNKYKINFKKIKKLKKQGCEIGLHGFNHSGKLPYLNKKKINKQIKIGINKLKDYNIKGFRSPLLLRNNTFLNILSNYFKYDSSIPDTDVNHPLNYRNGCCTIFPFFVGDMVELPLTIPQDVRLMRFRLTKQQIFSKWKEKIEFIKKNKGLAMLNIHPDNFASGNDFGLSCYEMLLKYISKINDKWTALPYEIAEWWKERDSSYIINKRIIGSKRAKINLF